MARKGNPYQLPVRQHTFPAKSISRFCGSAAGVEVYFKSQGIIRNLRPTDPPFVVREHWDAKAEGHFKDIEDAFQAMIEMLDLDGSAKSHLLDHRIASKMYASWYARAHFAKIEDQKLEGILGPSITYSDDDRERLEKAGVMTIGGDCKIPGRNMAWAFLLRRMDHIESALKGRKWGVMTSGVGEFLVPDRPPYDLIALPLSPRKILLLDYPSQTIPLISVKQINGTFKEGSHSYYFARQIENCPR